MGRPMDWLANSRRIGTFHQPAEPASAGAGTTVVDEDPMLALERHKRARQRQEELEAALEDEAEERELKRMERQAKMMQKRRDIEMMQNPPQSQSETASAQLMRDMMAEMAADKRALLEELRQARNESSNSTTTALMAQLTAMQARIESLGNSGPTESDPIGKLVRDLNAVTEVRNALDKVAPPPAPVDVRLSRQERMEELRIDREYELRKIESDAIIANAQAQKDAAAADVEVKKHRMDSVTQMVENAVGPLVAAFGAEKVAAMTGPKDPATAKAKLPFVCPNPECGQTGYVDEGTTFTACEHCHAAFPLRPIGAENHDNAVSSTSK